MKRSLLSALILAQTAGLQGEVYVNQTDFFNFGNGIFNFEREINNVLGGEKTRLQDSLSLGNGGKVSVSYKDSFGNMICFKNGEGPDFFVQEVAGKNDIPEDVEILVTSDKDLTPETEWVSLGVWNSGDYPRHKIPLEMPKGMALGYHILLKDPNTNTTTNYPGFDAGSIEIRYLCRNSFLS